MILNKGIGAGGANTNKTGKKFEDLTDNEERLIKQGYEKIKINDNIYGYYLIKKNNNKEIIFLKQNGLKLYMKKMYDIESFRCPDEAYIIKYNNEITIIKILEKKHQNSEGSCDTKLWAGPSLKREYELVLGNKFIIDYAFCLSSKFINEFNTKMKFIILSEILREHNILYFFGESEIYFNELDYWINNFE
jgi:hypothetical protein